MAFNQYNPDKPAKYCMLFKSLNDARLTYTYQSLVYAGKPKKEPSPFFISRTQNYVKELVTKLESHVSLQGRNISTDRLYISIPIAMWLLKKNITCIGTLQSNRVGIPDEAKSIKERENYSSWMHWEKEHGDLSITSYVVPSGKGKRNVLKKGLILTG